MGLAVTTVASGGLPVKDLGGPGGIAMTEVANGLAVTKVTGAGAGIGVTFVSATGGPVTPPVTYATWNASDKGANIVLSNGNLQADATASGAYQAVRATVGKHAGKFYMEFAYTAGSAVSANQIIGIGSGSASLANYVGSSSQSGGLDGAGAIQGVGGGTDGDPNPSDIISMAVDADNKTVWWRVNGGNWNANVANNPATNTGGKSFSAFVGPVFPIWNGGFNQGTIVANFGASAFTYAVPSGFTAGWPDVPASGPPLDAYTTGLTGAWSMHRKLLTSYGGAFNTNAAGLVSAINDQTVGARNFTAAGVSRPALSTLGSLASATFNSSTWTSMSNASSDNFITTSAGFFVWVGSIDALPPSFARLIHNFAQETFSMMVMSTNNAQVYNFDTNSDQIATALGGTGKHVITWRHDSGALYVSVDGGTEASIASGNTTPATGNFELSNSGAAAQAFDGKFVELYAWNVVPAAPNRAAIIAQAKTLLGI